MPEPWLLYFLAAVLFQSFVLTTGFGTSALVHGTVQPKKVLWQA